jgi:hypothetical protein
MHPRISAWLACDPDPETRRDLEALVERGDDAEIARRFRARLEFGTADLRGILGAGTGRMNCLVTRETTEILRTAARATPRPEPDAPCLPGLPHRRLSMATEADLTNGYPA